MDMAKQNVASRVNSPFAAILFTDKDGKIVESLTMDTKTGRPDYFISLSVTKPMQEAMTVSIDIAYVPAAAGKEAKNPNEIELLLMKYGGECYLQWGYGNVNGGLCPMCKCLITDFSTTMSNGYLSYSLKGVAKAVLYNYSTISVSTYTKDKPKKRKTAYEIIKSIYDEGKLADNYILDDELETTLKDVTYSQKTSMTGTPIKLLGDFVGTLKPSSTANKTTTNSSDDYFVLVVDDNVVSNKDNRGTLRVRRVNAKQLIGNGDSGEVIKFNWNSIGTTSNASDEVLSWSPNYAGKCLIFAAREEETETSIVNTINLGEGKVSVVGTSTNSVCVNTGNDFFTTSGLRGACSTDLNNKWWAKHLGQYCYTATLKVQGRPDSAVVGQTVYYVQPLIGTQEHHSAGYYLVKGITDEINSSGFTTEYELVKLGYTLDDNDEIKYFSSGVGFYDDKTKTTTVNGETTTKEYNYVYYNGFRYTTTEYQEKLLDTQTDTEEEENITECTITLSQCTATDASGEAVKSSRPVDVGTKLTVTADTSVSGTFSKFVCTPASVEVTLSGTGSLTGTVTVPKIGNLTIAAVYV